MLSHYFLLKVMSATVTFLMSSVFLNCVLSLFPLVLRKQTIFGIYFIQVILFIESIEFIDSFCIYLERFQQISLKAKGLNSQMFLWISRLRRLRNRFHIWCWQKTSGFGGHFRPWLWDNNHPSTSVSLSQNNPQIKINYQLFISNPHFSPFIIWTAI